MENKMQITGIIGVILGLKGLDHGKEDGNPRP